MKICQTHWDKLKELIDLDGLSKYISKDSNAAMANITKEINGEKVNPDPLMMCNNMILSRSIQVFGFEIFDGEDCPICFANKNTPPREGEATGDFWVRTLVPYVKGMFENLIVINKNKSYD